MFNFNLDLITPELFMKKRRPVHRTLKEKLKILG